MRTIFNFGPYRVDVVPGPKDQFLWVLCKEGRAVGRSSALFSSEDGLSEVTRLLAARPLAERGAEETRA